MTTQVPPAVLERVEHLLATRNVDGKVPLDICLRILDDMADITDRTHSWSCDSMRRYGIHAACRQPVHVRRRNR